MFIMPYSTDVHDGKIRLAGLEIIGICLVVHIFVSSDMRRVNRDLTQAVELWQEERMERHANGSSRSVYKYEADPEENPLTSKVDTVSGPIKELQKRIKEVQKTSLIYRFGLVPSNFKLYSIFTSMFTHAGWFHLIGNMIFFYVCGLAMEQYWGYWRFLIIYLACGIVAEVSWAIASMASGAHASGPLVGASGAIAGAMGAFLVTHARVKVKLFYIIGFWKKGVWAVPAYGYLGFWFLQQIVAALRDRDHSSGVAYTAHIGGFLAGAILGKLISSDYESEIVDPILARRQQVIKRTAKGNAIPMGFKETPEEEIANYRGKFQNRPAETGNIPEAVRGEADEPENSQGITAEIDGWEALDRQDNRRAAGHLSYAMSCYLQAPERNRARVAELLKKIIKERGRLPFSQNEFYQWGKRLGAAKDFKFAIICFDLAALIEGNSHIQKNSLLEASRLRIQTSYQLEKVRRDMEFLLTIEPQGIFANQAREMLQHMKSVTRLLR